MMLFADAMAIALAFPCIPNHHHTHFNYYLSASNGVGPLIVAFNFQHRFVLIRYCCLSYSPRGITICTSHFLPTHPFPFYLIKN